FGRSEELVGRAIAEHGERERVLIATKAGLEWRAGQVYRNASAERIRAEVKESLRRLRTDYIDIYQVHWPDPLVAVGESAADLRGTDPKFQPRRYRQYLDAVAALDRLARERYGKNVLALAVRWILDQGPTIALWGARRPDQLAPIEDVLGWSLDDAARADIDRILAKAITDPVGPEFMAPPAREES